MDKNNKFFSIIKGVVLGYLFMILEIFIYSIVLAYTNVPESSISICVFIFSLLSVFISSSLVCIKIKENGLKNGGIIGFLYIVFAYLIGSVFIGTFSLTSSVITTIIFNILLGMIGGIVGVNLAGNR